MLALSSSINPPLLATGVGMVGAAAGVWLVEPRRRPAYLVSFSAGVLLGVALFGLLPELVSEIGWGKGLGLAVAGYVLLLLIDVYVYRVCPTCAHDHDHNTCTTELHGFAGPLIVAAALHSFLDGWSIATAESAVPLGLQVAVPLAIALHKIPEGMALGGILRSAVGSRKAALAWCLVAEGTTAVGGAAGIFMAPHLGSGWIMYPLGIAGGWIAYLGYHAVHEEWRRRGANQAAAAAGGMAVAALIQRGVEAWLG